MLNLCPPTFIDLFMISLVSLAGLFFKDCRMNIIAQSIKLANSKFDKPYDKLTEKEQQQKAQLFLQSYIKAKKATRSL